MHDPVDENFDVKMQTVYANLTNNREDKEDGHRRMTFLFGSTLVR